MVGAQDSKTKQPVPNTFNDFLSYKYDSIAILNRLKLESNKKTTLPDYFKILSGWKIKKNQAWDILFSLRDSGLIEYQKFRAIKIKGGD